jgi:hypothetical protein
VYDQPMSLDDLLSDEERRRAAMVYAGMAPPAPAAPAAPAQQPPPAAQPPSGDFAALAQRYLEAQRADRQDALLSRAGAGLDAAARTINAGAGFNQPAMPTGGTLSRAAGVEDAARIEALGIKGTGPKADKAGKAPPDPNDPAIKRLQDFARARWPEEPEEVIAAITPTTLKEIRTTLDAKYGIQSREGLAADAGERDRSKTKQQDVHFWAKMKQDAEQFGVSDETRRYIADQHLKAAQAARDEASATKEKDKADARNVPGFEVVPDATPTADDAKKVKDTNEASLRLRGTIGDLRALHKKYGETPKGTGAELQQQALRAVQLEAKNIVGLGALSGPDFGLMQDLSAQDANSITQWVRRNFTGASLEQSLQGMERWMNTVVNATAASRGYRPKTAKPQRTTPDKVLPKDSAGNLTLDTSTLPPPPAGKVRVRKGTKVGTVPTANLKAMLDDGWEEVK